MLSLLLKLVSRLPLRAVHTLGGGAGRVLGLLPNKARRRAEENLGLCFPELAPEERERWVRGVLVETAKTFFESAAIWNWPGERTLPLVTWVTGEELIAKARQGGKGVIVILPHLGCWELAALYCSSLGPMTTLYKPPRDEELGAMALAGRQRLGARLVPTDTQGILAIRKALARGEMAGILPDQYPQAGSGVHVPFFGQPAYTMTLVARLVQKTGASLVYAFAERLPDAGGFRLHFLENPVDLTGLDVEAITAVMNQGIEACVRQIPTQYQWTYKRFRPDVDAYRAAQAKAAKGA
ncbi:MAG: lysophospholipid acyltransferase [Gammaproteobacteria bacterium]